MELHAYAAFLRAVLATGNQVTTEGSCRNLPPIKDGPVRSTTALSSKKEECEEACEEEKLKLHRSVAKKFGLHSWSSMPITFL